MQFQTTNSISTVAMLALAGLLGAPLAGATSIDTTLVVGEITTVIGQSQVLSAGRQQAALRGLPVRAGDRIETAVGGHVHVRFIDGGLVSVRPLSRLLIEDYRSSDAQTLAAIKFKLEVGVMRSVTGQWGEGHRDRFRLNTPVAAIGVKGTDFVVKADGTSTLASVNSGAIVMAPLEGACATALGPCQGDTAVLLSEDMRGTMLQYLQQNGHGTPRLVPAIDLLAHQAAPAQPVQNPIAQQPGSQDIADKTPVADTLANNQLQNSVSQASKPLIWLHNSAGWNVPANTISERYSEATVAGRAATAGNFFITLYRDETIQKPFVPQASSANFNLTNVSANYTPSLATGRPVEVVAVSNAQLSVNFAQSSLSTHMDFSSPSLGQANFSASANITPQGHFSNRSAQQNMAGAFSTTGDQAGYLFDKTFSGGKVSGLSLWSR